MNHIKACLLILVLALVLPLAAAAQGFSIISFENGYAPGFSLGNNNWNIASRFALNIHVSDKVSSGFVFIDGDGTTIPDYRLLRLNYKFLDRASLGLSLGSTGANMVTGLGFDVVAFQRRFQDALTTDFKMQIDYLFQPAATNGLTSGVMSLGLAFSIGI